MYHGNIPGRRGPLRLTLGFMARFSILAISMALLVKGLAGFGSPPQEAAGSAAPRQQQQPAPETAEKASASSEKKAPSSQPPAANSVVPDRTAGSTDPAPT